MDKTERLVWEIGEDEGDDFIDKEKEYEEWQDSPFDDYLAYVMFSPKVGIAKIGIAKDFDSLKQRRQEKHRQCGKTVISGVAPCIGGYYHAKETEGRMIEWTNSHPYIKKLGEESFLVEDPSWLDPLISRFCISLEEARAMTNFDAENFY